MYLRKIYANRGLKHQFIVLYQNNLVRQFGMYNFEIQEQKLANGYNRA